MKNYKSKILNLKSNAGFTLIETLVAVLILAIALDAAFTLISNNIFSAQYAKNEITAMYLAQEAIDHIRNDRDTLAFHSTASWDDFLLKYGYDTNTQNKTLCFSSFGCTFDANEWGMNNTIVQCSTNCNKLFYDDRALNGRYYTYLQTGKQTLFDRKIIMNTTISDDELDVTVVVNWKNGSNNHSRTLTTSLLKW